MLACITIQPHVKNKLTPQKLLPLSWDNRKKSKQAKTEHITAKEAEERENKLSPYWVTNIKDYGR